MKRFIFILFFLKLGLTNELSEFSTDYCSVVPDKTILGEDLKTCCLIHDAYYWMGGSVFERKLADRIFKKCLEKDANKVLARTMYEAVRRAGAPIWNASWKWGYGWSGEREDYQRLNKSERFLAMSLLLKTDLLSESQKKEIIKIRKLNSRYIFR